jgi:hypothetical protein
MIAASMISKNSKQTGLSKSFRVEIRSVNELLCGIYLAIDYLLLVNLKYFQCELIMHGGWLTAGISLRQPPLSVAYLPSLSLTPMVKSRESGFIIPKAAICLF